ncbi:TPA: hypothetical protein I7680_11030 [Vibrio vulnificus]|nr:hypothetical protein D8T50_20370 [Vibrio vulnificus]HAS8172018.1 hypothetical protein [Vibrio vulnificus]HAS8446132.1 hypothetical protein [Vibrio vulnificus]HAS8453658.1 hypothetical protein [Vibrio vulnificus]
MIQSDDGHPRLSTVFELVLFTSSYFPLFLILYIRDIEKVKPSVTLFSIFGYELDALTASPLSMILLFLSLICWLIIGRFCDVYLGKKHSRNEQSNFKTVTIDTSKRIYGDMINFTLPFLIGLFAFDYNSLSSITSLFVFMAFMFLFLRAENMLLLNPMFLLKNVTLHEINYTIVGDSRSDTARVLSIGNPKPSSTELYLKEALGTKFLCLKGQ